jgi:hypothetical protein
MVIIKTSATEVKTQAVSPELTVHFSATVAEQLGGAAGRWPLVQRRAPMALRRDYPALRQRARRGQ